MTAKSKIIVVIILILLASNVFLGTKYYIIWEEMKEAEIALEEQGLNGKILAFLKLFIQEVLRAEQEISFETRLNLETRVRGLEDQAILAQWERFTESQTELEAQEQVKNLLELLIAKIKI